MNEIIQKYKLVLLPLALVLIFDLSLLAMNYFITSQLEISSVNINIAGRQRMLSQRMTKDLMLIHYQASQGKAFDKNKNEMENAVRLFNQTLTAFINGSFAIDTAGKEVFIDRLEQTEIKNILNEATKIWEPLHQDLNTLITTDTFRQTELKQLIDILSVKNLQLLKLMNDFTNRLEKDAEKKIFFLRAVQTTVVIMILLSFALATIQLYRRENYYNNLMEKSTDIVAGIDIKTAKTTFVSNSIHQILGYKNEHYLGKPANLLFASESKVIFSKILDFIKRTGQLENDRCEVELLKKNGDIVIADMAMQLTTSENGKTMELSAGIRDISERKKAEIALSELAYKDTLTNLPNRTLFFELAEHSINLAKRHKTNIVIMFIDLDGFKSINDEFGHEVGDKLLIEVARRIKNCLRASDSVSRIGGDEFIVLLHDVAGKNEIKVAGEKIITSISQDIMIGTQNCRVGASIGIALYPENGSDINSLIKNADKAMYKVKKTGKNATAFS
jgi:diguanylate cyclase (GGDEF)-like protein/PAS domain S-box-containing protein